MRPALENESEASTSSTKCENATSESLTGLRVKPRFVIPRTELAIKATRSSGAGGQHVNKTASRVEVVWSIVTSTVPSDAQRARLLNALASKLSGDGELRVVASDTRSQFRNREIAEARLVELVRDALVIPKARKATKPSLRQKQARLDEKRMRANRKKDRRGPVDDF